MTHSTEELTDLLRGQARTCVIHAMEHLPALCRELHTWESSGLRPRNGYIEQFIAMHTHIADYPQRQRVAVETIKTAAVRRLAEGD